MTQPISIMPCMDMQDGRVVKGVHFVDIKDAGDPVQCAEAYCKAEVVSVDVGFAKARPGCPFDFRMSSASRNRSRGMASIGEPQNIEVRRECT